MILEPAGNENSSNSLQDLVTEASRYRRQAELRGYTRDGNSHSWIRYYALRTNLLLGPSSVEWLRPPKAAAALPSLQGSSEDMEAGPLQKELEAPITISTLPTRAASLDPNAYNPSVFFAAAVPSRSLTAIRDAWIAKELRKTEAEFTSWSNLVVLAGTYNAGGRMAASSLASWLRCEKGAPDLVLLGFQEIDASTGAYLYNDEALPDLWIARCIAALAENGYGPYEAVGRCKNVGMLAIALVKRDLVPDIGDVRVTYVGTGLLGMMGNKGCAALRIRIRGSYLVLVASHLAADQDAVQRRNADFLEIIRRTEFPWTAEGESFGAPGYVSGTALLDPSTVTYGNLTASMREWRELGVSLPPRSGGACIFDADHLIWVGDLNYRIGLAGSEVRAAVAKSHLDALRKSDQLSAERRAGRVFSGFDEHKISFPPTYKFDINSSTYDTSEKQRTPAWTDRVLWYAPSGLDREGPGVECLGYKAALDIRDSDHRPVCATLAIRVRAIDRLNFTDHLGLINRLLDRYENDAYPDVVLSKNSIEIGEIRYLETKEFQVTVENACKIAAGFDFLLPSEMQSGEPAPAFRPGSWVNTTPSSGTLLPRASTAIRIVVCPRKESLKGLNTGGKMDEILVLRVLNGAEKFVAVSGTFLPSCFGVSYDTDHHVCVFSVANKRPVLQLALNMYSILSASGRSMRQLGWQGLQQAISSSPSPPPQAPRQLQRMLDFLMRHGMDVPGLFVDYWSADSRVELYIRECLDTDAEFSEGVLMGREYNGRSSSEAIDDGILASAWQATLGKPNDKTMAVHAMSSVVIRFLSDVDGGVVPARLVPRVVTEGSSTTEAGMLVLRQLDEHAFATFWTVVGYLREVLASYLYPDQISAEKLGWLWRRRGPKHSRSDSIPL